jgi:hypothetical protein
LRIQSFGLGKPSRLLQFERAAEQDEIVWGVRGHRLANS